ncbi:GNAT family N-acetyltransferase [bacterium]|nr:GNAT family N-acetyltransferase [bacterium]
MAPLVEKTIRGVRRQCLAGAGELHEPADFVADDLESLHRLLEVLLHEGRPILLERVLCQSPSINAIKEIFQRRAVVIKRPQAPCPFIELNDTWLEPESHLNSGRRSDFRRARRKAEKLGEVSTQIIAPDVHELNDLLDEAFEIEGKSWKGDAKTALIHDAKRARFFQEYARHAAEEGILRICFLKIDGQSAAMQLAIEHKQGFWLLKVGYDDQFRSCSPGLLLMRETIRYAAEKDLKSYEFLGVAEDWKAVWTKAEHQTVSLWIYPISWCGLSALVMDLSSKLFSRWSRS